MAIWETEHTAWSSTRDFKAAEHSAILSPIVESSRQVRSLPKAEAPMKDEASDCCISGTCIEHLRSGSARASRGGLEYSDLNPLAKGEERRITLRYVTSIAAFDLLVVDRRNKRDFPDALFAVRIIGQTDRNNAIHYSLRSLNNSNSSKCKKSASQRNVSLISSTKTKNT